MNWKNLYEDRQGTWLKGNLHMHTSPASACAVIPIEESIGRYIELGYDFLSISDHLCYTNAADSRITLIPGLEWNSPVGEHMGIHCLAASVLVKAIEFSNQDMLLEFLAGTDALVILNHPNWQLIPHYRREALQNKQHYHGIEVYNGVIERLEGTSISSDKWDYLLTQNRKVLGFANDDSHCYTDIGLACNMVRSKSRKPADILDAMKVGNFYSSSGATIEDIRREQNTIELETDQAQEIRAVVDGGRMVCRVIDHSIKLDVSRLDASYVRLEAYGYGSAMAWTQPFYL